MRAATVALPSLTSVVPAASSTRAMTTSSASFRRMVRSAACSMADPPGRRVFYPSMLSLYALSCGALEFDKSLFFPAEAPGTPLVAPVASWLVVHPKGKVLFDTGIRCDALADPAGRLGKRVAS